MTNDTKKCKHENDPKECHACGRESATNSKGYVTVYEVLGAKIDRLEALLKEWRRQPMGELSQKVMADLCRRTEAELENRPAPESHKESRDVGNA